MQILDRLACLSAMHASLILLLIHARIDVADPSPLSVRKLDRFSDVSDANVLGENVLGGFQANAPKKANARREASLVGMPKA
jgi:hypothetical protein